MDKLVCLMKESSSIAVMDKYIEQQDIEFLTDFVKNKMPDNDWEIEVYINGYQQHKEHKVTIYENVKSTNEDINKLVNSIVDACNKSK